jgi:transcriptional regulator with GAF, ATPase, and Fis domain
VWTSLNVLEIDDLPLPLRPPVSGIQQFSVPPHLQTSRTIDYVLDVWNVKTLLAVPLDGGGLFWTALDRERRFNAEEIDSTARLLERIVAKSRASESIDGRTQYLERLDFLGEGLPILSAALDVRDVFDRLASITKRALPHDAAVVSVYVDEFRRVRLHALSGIDPGHLPEYVENPYPTVRKQIFEYAVYRDLTLHPIEKTLAGVKLGYRSTLRVPLRFDGQFRGVLDVSSRQTNAFRDVDVPVARRIADLVTVALSHERLAEKARIAEEVRARAANLDLVDELLATVTSAGELPEVFSRVSGVAQKVLGHDALVLTAVLPDGVTARVYASKAPESAPFPDIVAVPPLMLRNPNWDYDLVEDLQQQPDQKRLDAVRLGYRSALRVAIRLGGEYAAGLSFLSFAPARYTTADVAAARRIADTLTLSFSRERSKALMKQADEATARAAQLESRVQALTEELDARSGYRRVVGQSKEWRQVLTQATQVAATDTTVLLLGASGTGKEVVARFLHRGSARKTGPFVALNCAALPEHLLEAELFGYERGAFTGAVQSKPGQLEQAAGGTLFLDEVGEMSPSAQAKFLRVLQEREFQRLGGTRVLRTDARIVAATNRDLFRAMEKGQFREDLFYRLNVFAIHLPSLRERKDDILPLTEAFIAEFGRSLGRPPAGLSRDARQALFTYDWPGNVRELRNVLERAAILCDGGLIGAEHLALRPPATSAPAVVEERPIEPVRTEPVPVPPPTAPGDLKTMERALIERALLDARFNKSLAAKALGLTRSQLYVRLRKYGLD